LWVSARAARPQIRGSGGAVSVRLTSSNPSQLRGCPMTRRSLRILSLPLLVMMIAACTSGSFATPTPAPTAAPTATTAAAPTPIIVTVTPTPTANPCDKSVLTTLTAGKLTVGTDNPAYPPYFQPPASGNAPAPWKLGDPTNGQGFESAVAYAVAQKLDTPRPTWPGRSSPSTTRTRPAPSHSTSTLRRSPTRPNGRRRSICRTATTS